MTAMDAADRNFILYGTEKMAPAPIHLTAGALSVDLSDGNLRSIRFEDIEVLRGIAFLVRDRDWGTYAPSIADLVINQQEDAFEVGYRL